MKALSFLLAIAVSFAVYHHLHRPLTYSPGVLIPSDPSQIPVGNDQGSIEHGEYHLKPLAHFSINARVLHRKNYGFDRGAKLVPVDLALGWGPMSDQAVIDKLEITQSMRFYWYQYESPPPIPKEQIVSHSTNLHVIPDTPAVKSFCKSLRQGELIHLEGDLVEATGPGMSVWRSSLSRTDSGNGACELMLVKECGRIVP